MSHAAREWALRQDLKPIPKFVLVVLGDAANDQGLCWPRTSTLAGKVGVSTRTVQRAIQLLVKRELITVEQRYRSDGSCSSNLYRLMLEGGDSLSPAPDCADTTPGHPCQGPPRHRCHTRNHHRNRKRTTTTTRAETGTARSWWWRDF